MDSAESKGAGVDTEAPARACESKGEYVETQAPASEPEAAAAPASEPEAAATSTTNSVRQKFNGDFMCSETTGFEDFMEEMGVPWLVRKGLSMFSTGNPKLEIIMEGEDTMVWNLENISPSHEFMRRVTAGLLSFDTTDLMGYVCEVKAWWEEDKFVVDLKSKTEGGKGYRVIREVQNDFSILAKMIPNGNNAKQMTRTFSRLPPPTEPPTELPTEAANTTPAS